MGEPFFTGRCNAFHIVFMGDEFQEKANMLSLWFPPSHDEPAGILELIFRAKFSENGLKKYSDAVGGENKFSLLKIPKEWLTYHLPKPDEVRKLGSDGFLDYCYYIFEITFTT